MPANQESVPIGGAAALEEHVNPPAGGHDVPTVPEVECGRSRQRLVDRFPERTLRVLTVVGFGLPAGLYLWLIHTYALNVITVDQFDDATVIRGSYVHYFDWHLLWAQHNETRIFFPNVIVVALAHADHLNIIHEEYLSALMLLTGVTMLICAHQRRSPNTPLLCYCPVAILLLSVVQWQNTLWGFQLAWYLTFLSLIAAIFFIDGLRLNLWTVTLAAGFGVVASLSLIQGFLVWPVGLFLLYHRKRLRYAVPWSIVAAATAVLYFRNFNSHLGAPYPRYASQHLWSSVRFFVFAAGDIVGVQPNGHYSVSGYPLITLFGVVLLAVGAAVVLALGIRRDATTGSPIGVALILFAVMFDLMVTNGRITLGFSGAGASRYTTFDLLFLAGIFLSLLGRSFALAEVDRSAPAESAGTGFSATGAPWSGKKRALVIVVLGVTAILIVVQSLSGLFYGMQSASRFRSFERQDLLIEEHPDKASGLQLAGLYIFAHQAPWILAQLNTFHEHGLVFYANHSSSSSEGDSGG